ncbi:MULTISPECIES: hypothetical protein [unclassified Providencia]|uniref:hypothetical protein n=1 Tax=unclassified Providencia TaxID=2633465 RepID=UPI00234BA4AB|nr:MULTISPECIES: hypothetical protein [unclassified Providencia]
MKDQRIEFRLPQQQLDELDNFIDSIDTQYKPTRADVLRSFIAQGVRGKFHPNHTEEDDIPLGLRLNIFFQICQQMRSDYGSLSPLSRASDTQRYMIRDYKESTVTVEALVRQVYLQRFTWFYELDQTHLQAINRSLCQGMYVLSLMNPRHNPETCSVLDSVIEMRDMFIQIDRVLQETEDRLSNTEYRDLRDSLTRIEGYAQDNEVPLRFKGYPATAEYTQQVQMWAMLNWIENGEGGHAISCQRLTNEKDLTSKYATMLEVFRNITLNQTFDLNALEQLVKSRLFYQN